MRWSVVYRFKGSAVYRERYFQRWEDANTFYHSISDQCDLATIGEMQEPLPSVRYAM